MQTRVGAGRRGRRRGRAASLLVCGLAVAGCTILAPIQTPEHDRRFPLDIADTEKVPCVDPDDGRSRQCTQKLKESLDDYYGDLARAIWETDLRRRKLVAMGTEKAQIANLYNALLWPLGAILITKKIHNPDWSTLDTAAVATAGYGLLNSGIPERDKLYLRAASRMACSMVTFEPLLYHNDEIHRGDKDGSTIFKEPVVLEERIEFLRLAIQDFEAQRDVLVATLKAKPAKPAPPANPSSIAAIRALALGNKAAAGTPAGDLPGFLSSFQGETDRLLTNARAQLLEVRKTLALLHTSGKRLRQLRGRIDFALTEALVAGTPALVSPEARAREIASALQSQLTASKAFSDKISTLVKQSGTSQTALWTLTDPRLQALDATSQENVREFWRSYRLDLLDAQQRIADWMGNYQTDVQTANDSAASMGCNDGTLDDFSKQLLKLVDDTAAAATAAAAAAQLAASGASK